MASSDIIFIKGQGASGRTAAGQDFISGLLLYSATVPSGFAANTPKLLYSTVDAENNGIKADYNDETKATATYAVTAVGANGDTATFNVAEPFGVVKTIGTYVKVSGDSTVTKVGDGIAAAINAGTLTHGYTASNNAGTVTITAKAGLGIFLNSGTPLSVVLSAGATLAGTITQFTGGVYSKQAVWHYHISEFFRANPSGQLWVGFYSVPSTYTFTEITSMQMAADGKIRQIGIYKDGAAYASADLTTIDSVIKVSNDAKHKPLSALYAADLKAVADITTIADLSALTANKVSSVIGQDGNALGATLFYTTGKSITQLGVSLGMLSLSAVSEDFGQTTDKFNISDGTENEIPAFANGQLVSSLGDNTIDAIDAKRHIFGKKYVGTSGTFFNDNHCAIVQTSDYAYINDNRTIDKAIRGIYIALLPYLKGKVLKNADGTLASTAVAFLEAQALQPLYQMSRDGDLGEVVPSDVYIDPSQNVTATNTLIVQVKLNQNPIARFIQVPISFK